MARSLRSVQLAAAAVAATSLLAWDATTHTAEAKVDGPKVSWRFSTWGKRRAFTEGPEHIAKRLAEQTGGNFTMKIFYGEALSKSKEHLDGIKINAFDAGNFCNFYHPGKNPAFMVFSLPFLPLADVRVSAYVRNKLFEHPALKADMDRWNAIAYMSTLLPQYEFLGKGKPPMTLEDWKGLRVRAGGGIGEAMVKLGATRTTVTAVEIYTTMQRGALDAVSLPFTYAHAAYKTDEISSWFTANLSPGTSECPVVLNKDSYNKLPPQYKKLLQDLKQEANEVYFKVYEAADKKNLPQFEKKLKKIVYSDAELQRFREVAGKPVWDEWVAKNKDKFDAQGVLDAVFKLAKEAK
ncbi:MAG TPA: C4-dicarboxylate TRAP transporter substrate-binding protein [Burkholderiales bacterium]|nr:C4-dicarboxylate TRAP transporter substrate-binding protein [Burkholderiales bacterium]